MTTSTIKKALQLKLLHVPFNWTPPGVNQGRLGMRVDYGSGISLSNFKSVTISVGNSNALASVSSMGSSACYINIYQVGSISEASVSGTIDILYE
jgi:hypothetical protein